MPTGKVSRPGTETKKIEPCPQCEGEITVTDCGYSAFNPGTAKCERCRIQWRLGYVNSAWDAVDIWNQRRNRIIRKLQAFELLKVNRRTTGRTSERLAIESQAAKLLDDMRKKLMGSKPL